MWNQSGVECKARPRSQGIIVIRHISIPPRPLPRRTSLQRLQLCDPRLQFVYFAIRRVELPPCLLCLVFLQPSHLVLGLFELRYPATEEIVDDFELADPRSQMCVLRLYRVVRLWGV